MPCGRFWPGEQSFRFRDHPAIVAAGPTSRFESLRRSPPPKLVVVCPPCCSSNHWPKIWLENFSQVFQSDTKMLLAASTLRWIPIHGQSMWPSLRPHDLAGVMRLRVHPQEGQVVVARQGNRFIVHRVLRTSEHSMTCFGDNCAAPDAPIPVSHLYGVVMLVRRRGRVLVSGAWDRGRTALGSVRRRLIQGARRLKAVLG